MTRTTDAGGQPPIREIFAMDITRRIEEVIKADQEDPRVVAAEIQEYVVTEGLGRDFAEILERYAEAARRPTEGVGVWISGFFGSGKSSFAKVLGHILENRDLDGVPSSVAFERRLPAQGTERLRVLLRQVNEQIPTLCVIVDVLTERNVRRSDEPVSLILYRALLRRLGLAEDIDLAEMEYTLIRGGRMDDFRRRYAAAFGETWDARRNLVAFSRQEASRILHEMDPQTHPAPDSYLRTYQPLQPSTRWLAQRFLDLMELCGGRRRLVFVADEVGQYIARDLGKVQDVQGLVHSIAQTGQGRIWLVATSQEKLDEVVRGLEGTHADISRLQDRFPTHVDLAPKDITEVAAARVLAKRAEISSQLRTTFGRVEGNLRAHARFTGTARAAGWTAEAFADFYPLLPDRAQLLVAAVDGLRAGTRAAGQAGGSNRTLIKLAQQAVVHPVHGVGGRSLGALFTLDRAYGLLEGSFPSETRAEVEGVRHDFPNKPLHWSVAACVAVLERIHDLPATAENVAAALHPAWDAPGGLPEVQAVLDELVAAERLRKVGPRYEVITAAGRDWQKERNGINGTSALPGLRHEFLREALTGLPPYRQGNRNFTARVRVGREWLQPAGDLTLHVLVDEPDVVAARAEEVREASRVHPDSAYWLVAADDYWDRMLEEVYRSREMLDRYAAKTRGTDEDAPLRALVAAEETQLQDTLLPAARRETASALLRATLCWQGVPYPPDKWGADPAKVVGAWMQQQVPKTFTKFDMAAVRVSQGDARRMITEADLSAAPSSAQPAPTGMGLVTRQGGRWTIDHRAPPCVEVLSHLRDAGGPVSGKQLETDFRDAPYGWDLDVLMVVVAALMRAGQVEAVASAQTVTAADAAAAAIFSGPAAFRAASFRPRRDMVSIADVARAAMVLQALGASTVPVDEARVVQRAGELAAQWRERAGSARTALVARRWPVGAAVEDVVRLSREWGQGRAEAVIRSITENAQDLEAAQMALTALEQALQGSALERLEHAWAVRTQAGRLAGQGLFSAAAAERAAALGALLDADDFYLRLPSINEATAQLEAELEEQAASLRQRLGHEVDASAQDLRESGQRLGLPAERVAEVLVPLLRLKDGLDGSTGEEAAGRLAMLPAVRDRVADALAGTAQPERPRIAVKVREVLPSLISSPEELEPALEALRARCRAVLDQGGTVVLQ